MPPRKESEKTGKSSKIKKEASRYIKRENPKATAAPRKRGVASEVKSVGDPDWMIRNNGWVEVPGSLSGEKMYRLEFDKNGWAKKPEEPVYIEKKSLDGVGDFWRSRLPKEITCYGSGMTYRINTQVNPKVKKRVAWLEDRVAYLTQENEIWSMRIRGLEKTLCHLMDALKK